MSQFLIFNDDRRKRGYWPVSTGYPLLTQSVPKS
jgi:hypothetical protein